jgi:O-antigen/teichoic acid export membrane protein
MPIVKNSAYLFLARFINSLAILGLILVISRRLGPDIFGGYSFLNAVVMTGIVFANFGLDAHMVREVSRDHSLGHTYLASVLGFKAISSLIVMVGLYGLFRIFLIDQAMVGLLAFFSIVICLNSISQSLWFYGDAFQKFRFHAGLWAISNIIKVPMVWLFISVEESLKMVIYALVISEFISLIVSGLCIYTFFGGFPNSFSIKFISKLCKEVWPLAIIFILSALYFRIDLMMLEIMKGDKAAGIYSAAYKLIEFLSIVPGTICVAALPGLSVDYCENIETFKANSVRALLFLGTGGIGTGLFFYLFAKQIILQLYGPLFFESITCLSILSGVVFFLFINGYLAYIAIAMNNEKGMALILFISTILNVLFNYYLIPKYSYIGASLSTLFSEIFMSLSCVLLLRKSKLLSRHAILGFFAK